MKILLVEDNPGDARLIREMVLAAKAERTVPPGSELAEVARLDEALEAVATTRFDVVLLDLGLPDARGLEGPRRIRKAAPDLPIVIMTGLDDRETTNRAMTEGVQDFLLKEEVNARWLGRAIRYAVERVRAESRRQQLAEHVQRARKLESLAVMAGGLAHDFNNLLQIISGNASLASLDLSADSPARDNLERIDRAVTRAKELTTQMLLSSGLGAMVWRDLDLSAEIDNSLALMKTWLPKNVHVKYNLAVALPAVRGDGFQLRQLLVNLVTNAAEAIGESRGVISIATGVRHATREVLADCYVDDGRPEGSYVFVDVSDSGKGMDAQTIARVFDPFFSTKFAGRGLGGATVLGIVRGHRGSVKVTSEPDRGTKITVLLPSKQLLEETLRDTPRPDRKPVGVPATPERPGPHEPPAPPVQAPDRLKGTVLVVDDEDGVREVAQLTLESAGFETLTASDGQEALDLLRARSDQISVVLLDATMPRMSGPSALAEIRRIAPGRPVIMMSGYSEADTLGATDGEPPEAFIQKPYRAESLLATVCRVLTR
ncbi:MAG: response regulator [Candidatus Riflebacteria bacterium]|nr:response regulator [Candidatus Riflebacteria bacterium]